jgi:hypothetical protein
MSWARLLKRVFDIDIEHCPNCGGALKIIAAIEDPPVIIKILSHLGLPTALRPSRPAQKWVSHQPQTGIDIPPDPAIWLGHRKRWFKIPIHPGMIPRLFACALVTLSLPVAQVSAADTPVAEVAQLRIYSSLWQNLHHFLYVSASARKAAPGRPLAMPLPPGWMCR